ncbi:MAG: Cache 3/Cache 2 fusion domain-containing protein [Desulfobacter sp.]
MERQILFPGTTAKIRAKITAVTLALVAMSAAVVIAVFLSGVGEYRDELEKELEKQIYAEVEPLARAMYRICKAMHQASSQQRSHGLTIMRQLMEKQGRPGLTKTTRPVQITDAAGNTATVALPDLVLGNTPLGLVPEPGVPVPVVDEVMALTGFHASIMLRMNDTGDFIRVATSVVKNGKRQIGSVVPAVNGDGTPNLFCRDVLRGDTAVGRTYVDDFVFVSTARPLRDADNRIIGLYGLGIRQDLMEDLRQVFMDTPVGKSGYFFILGAKGRQRGRYILSHKGERDGENILNTRDEDGGFLVRDLFRRALSQAPGEVTWNTYTWQNPGDASPRKKYAALIYFKPLDWIIGASAYEADFIEASQRLDSRLEKTIYRVLASGLIVLVVSTLACWLLGKRIVQPLNRAVGFADAISRGSFPPPLDITAADETGRLGQALNTMSQKLQKHLEERRQAEHDFRTLYESSRDALVLISDETFIDCNQAALEIFGATTKEDILGKKPFEMSPDRQPGSISSRAMTRDRLRQAMVSGSSRFEWVHFGKANRRFFTEVQLSAMEIRGKQMILGAIRDITQRKKDEEQLLRLRSYLSRIIGSMPSVLAVVDNNGIVTLWNRMAEERTGIPAAKARGCRLFKVLPHMTPHQSKINKALELGTIQKALKNPHKTQKGAVYEDIIIYPLITEKEKINGAVIRIDDVTRQVRMEEVMIQSEKMMSVGGLAAGMAHEINNPLAGMIQGAQVVMNRLSQDLPKNQAIARELGLSLPGIRAYVEERGILRQLSSIRDAGSRAARIVDNMLSFSRGGSLHEVHDLGMLLDRTLELAGNDYDLKKRFDFKDIEIIREYAPNVPRVRCEGSQVQQVFFNILKNGAEAMSEQADLRGRPCFTLAAWQEEHMACVSITDNGPGMDEATRKRVFEPFFTTKPVGVGTGLGLSVSFFIITRIHKGELRVSGRPGRGTKFVVKLPVASGPPENNGRHEKQSPG